MTILLTFCFQTCYPCRKIEKSRVLGKPSTIAHRSRSFFLVFLSSSNNHFVSLLIYFMAIKSLSFLMACLPRVDTLKTFAWPCLSRQAVLNRRNL